MICTLKRNCSTGLILLLSLQSLMAQNQSPQTTPAADQANALFQAQKWAEAATAFEAITKAEPDNGRAWFNLGASLLHEGEYARAGIAYQQAAVKLQAPVKMYAMYNVAVTYAHLKDKDQAFEWLRKILTSGVPGLVGHIRDDPDFSSLSDDARFKELLVEVDKSLKPCMYQPEHKQFDFWIGEWNVQDKQGQQVGTSSIQRIENGCVILENWTGGQGGTGRSVNFYDAALHKWRQAWADSSGGISEFAGEYKDGAIRFEGESHTPSGTKIQRRLTFFNLAPDRVRQFSEASTDGGKTWGVDYDFTYVRRHMTSFDILPAPDTVINYKWIKLKEDAQGDGRSKGSADGKALSYFYDAASDMLWFKLELYSKVNWEAPAVSVSIDTDADQSTGIPWYGANTKFMFDKMLSVGATEKRDGRSFGYNGITNAAGVKIRDWINEKSGDITFYVDAAGNAYILGVKRTDIAPNLRKFNLIGSVGQNALWNDDIGEEGYSTIELPPPAPQR